MKVLINTLDNRDYAKAYVNDGNWSINPSVITHKKITKQKNSYKKKQLNKKTEITNKNNNQTSASNTTP